jgi:hypothetical protein
MRPKDNRSRRAGSRRLTLAPAVALVSVMMAATVAACGGSSGSSSGDSTGDSTGDSSEVLADVECTGSASDAGLGDGLVCADNGFRPTSDDFSFPNWAGVQDQDGGDGFTLDTLVRLYGATEVCVDGIADPCEPTPIATQTIEQWSSALAGGRCEGMATLSLRYFLGLDQSGVASTVELSRPNVSLEQEINYWWSTQFVDEVKALAAESRTKDPVTLTKQLASGLTAGLGYTIGIYDEGFGHAVTPFAVTKVELGYVIHIYDNNAPGEARTISIDEAANTWTYENAAANPDGTPAAWSGSTGTLELTPMSARSAPFACSFCDQGDSEGSATTKGYVSVNLAAGGSTSDPAAGLLIATSDGRRVGVAGGVVVNEIAGAIYTVGKGGLGTSLVNVELPVNSTEYSIEIVSADGSDSSSEIDTVVSVASPNGSLTTVKSRRTVRPGTGGGPGAGAPLEIDADAGIEISNDSATDADVAVATNRERVQTALPPAGRLKQRDRGGSADISATDASGAPIVEQTLEVKSFEKLPPGAVPSTSAPRNQSSGSSTPPSSGPSSSRPGSSVASSSSTPRSSTTVVRSSSTSVARASSSTTVVRSSTTVVRSSTTTVARSSTTTVARSSTTVPRSSTTVPRSSTSTTTP